jgi:hypothetical protein
MVLGQLKRTRKIFAGPGDLVEPIQLAQTAVAWFTLRAGAHMVELADTLL